jgi:two-component system sensor histidine kinase/response regulator
MTAPSRRRDNAPGRTRMAEFLHDLRTPLNQIIGYSEMLTEQAQEEGRTEFVPDLQKIHGAGQQMLSLLSSSPRLPEAQPQVSRTKERLPKSPPVPDSSQALILLVDDNRENRDMLSRRLERQGYGVATAEDGRQAMDAVRARMYDLVLLDIMMPEMDGYAVLQQLKADEALRHIPVIMISALDELDSVVRCIEMGAEDYLPKPFDPTLLKARIGASLEKKQSRDRERLLFEQLQQNYQHLQELEKLRDDLTNMIVHDLRTPLTSVIAGMQTLEVVGSLDQTQREMVAIAISGGETLLGMINDLLEVEKMESGAMPLDYAVLDADELVSSAARQVASLCKSKNLTLVRQIAADLPPFQGDESKVRRILVNLLGNAIKFTQDGGTLTLTARPGEDRRSVVFSLSDTGEGIPPEAFERIFEKFGQVTSRQGGRTMSTGLGLTFCKLAVEAHGGRIGVESTPGSGSTFTFTLPRDGRDQSPP